MIPKRKKQIRNTIMQVYISCEGYTERDYFLHLNQYLNRKGLNKIINIKSEKARKQNADAVVEHAKIYFYTKDLAEFQKIYCVFDKDRNTDNQIKNAINTAEEINAEIIFSNPCFEVWFLSHFKDNIKCTTKDKLNNFLSKNDKLGDNFKKQGSNNFYRTHNRIQIAKETSGKIDKKDIKYTPSGNPHTDVYKVIEYIENIINASL